MTRILVVAFLLAYGEAFCVEEGRPFSERNTYEAPPSRSIRSAGMINKAKRWEGNTIPYQIDPDLPRLSRKTFFKATNHIKGRTCIRFRNRSNEPNFLNVTHKAAGPMCKSKNGKIGGSQVLALLPRCRGKVGIYIHELMHAIGFLHEHKTIDRDEFVTINDEFIPREHKTNFWMLLDGRLASPFGVPYDYQSILHYSRTQGSPNGSSTIIPLVADAEIPGTVTSLSQYDIMKVNNMYCPGTIGFRIQNVENEKYLTIIGNETLSAVATSDWRDEENQKFTADWYALQDPSKGAYIVPWKQASSYIEILSAPGRTHIFAFDWGNANTTGQVWWIDRVKHAKNSRWQIKNKILDKCISKGKTQAVLVLCNQTDRSQIWKMQRVFD